MTAAQTEGSSLVEVFHGGVVKGGGPAQPFGAEEAGVEGEHDSFPAQLLGPHACRAVGRLPCRFQ